MALVNKGKVGIGATVIFLLALLIPALGLIGNEFMPQTDRGEFGVSVEFMPGYSVEQTNQTGLQIEKMLSQMPEIKRSLRELGHKKADLLLYPLTTWYSLM